MNLLHLTGDKWKRNIKTHTWVSYNKGTTSNPHVEIRCASCGWVRVFNGFSHMTPDCTEYKMDQALR